MAGPSPVTRHPQQQAPQQQVPDVPEPFTDDDGVPVFGVESTVTYQPVRFEVHPDGGEPYREEFQMHTEADAGAIMEVLAARDQLSQGLAIANLLRTLLRNDDGVPMEWFAPLLEDGQYAPAMDDDGYVIKDEEERPLYRDPAGDLVSDTSLLVVEFEAGSSRRRFVELMDDPTKRVPLTALVQIAKWVVTRASSRPTRRQQPSTTTRSRTPRGSRAKQPSRG